MTVKYPGKLGKLRPHNARSAGVSADAGQMDAWWRAEIAEQHAVLVDLCNFYSIDPGDWRALAWRLAEEHVPGMGREKGPRGARKKWNELDQCDLRTAINQYIQQARPRKISVNAAASYFARREPWKSKLAESKNPADALRKQYEQAVAIHDEWMREIDALDMSDKRYLLRRLQEALGIKVGPI